MAENEYLDASDLQAPRQHCTTKRNDFCHGNHCTGSRTLPEIFVFEHSSPYHPKMQVKALLETICDRDPPPSSLGPS